MPRRPSQHVVPHEDGWAVRKGGAARVTEIFDTQYEAIERGIEIAKNQETELAIHDRQGRIREKNSYGNDPFPPIG